MTKNKNTENNIISKGEGVISNLINLAGVTIGIIILSIGGIMFLESIFKLYILDIKQDRYASSFYECNMYDIDRIEAQKLVGGSLMIDNDLRITSPVQKKKIGDSKDLTEKDKEFLRKKYSDCKIKAKKETEDNFIRNQKLDIAESVAFILVGIPLIYFYQRRRKTKK